MPKPIPEPIQLSETARGELEKLVKRHKVGQQQAVRGRIILGAAAGKNNSQIAQELGVSVDMARLWRGRWRVLAGISLEDLSVAERLEDLPRPGASRRITADQRCQIEQLACELPEQSGRPISHWTNRELADEIKKREIVAEISARHAGRLLKRGGYTTAFDPLLAHAGGG